MVYFFSVSRKEDVGDFYTTGREIGRYVKKHARTFNLPNTHLSLYFIVKL